MIMEGDYQAFVSERREQIEGMVADAARAAGRSRDELLVEAVSKTVGMDEVAAAWRAGWRVFAENRPQELTRKFDAAKEDPELASARFDMIGNLQKNKINQVLGRATLIHSVSSAHLAEAVSKRAAARGMVQPVLLEVNVSGEESKSGFSPDELRASFEGLVGLEGIELRGLMTMAPAGNASVARRTFEGLRRLRDELNGSFGTSLEELSCGMSDDFVEAVAEGSTILRLGRVVFSPDYKL
jgi:pyridoxal phosphate enzyme (YggS family)